MQGALIAGLLVVSATGCQPSVADQEQEALDFLYAYMPLPDSVDYPREFWQASVQATLQARQEMPWGKSIPEREWRHFVLPLRVNNENLDSARIVLYRELKERVQGLSMYDAVLEVNHWCHEHVTYQPSDSRTKSPLVTMQTAIGRCGEESTFTVAALRAVGIPARQVYTPRWAHTDDNHAWVEAWVDGQWHFLGACEPEPVLDLGWFNSPASRGMLMHTKVFGAYDGPEEVVGQNRCYTEINVTENYAPVSKLNVCVQDIKGHPVPDATVDFRLYNYAELFSLVNKQTDENGRTFLTSGLGDLVVWASRDGRYGFQKASVGRQDSVIVRLEYSSADGDLVLGSLDLDLTPPQEHNNMPQLTQQQIDENNLRKAQEDSIRNAYMEATFCPVNGHVLPSDPMLQQMPEVKARSNWHTLQAFKGKRTGQTEAGKAVIDVLGRKDLQDVSLDVLKDVGGFTVRSFAHPKLWSHYIVQPRVSNEMLTPHRQVLSQAFEGWSAEELIQWVKDSIRIDESRNPQQLCMSPVGVYTHRTTDAHSRDIFFVAAARSAAIPARIDGVTGKVQWADAFDKWHDVLFSDEAQESIPQGILQLTMDDHSVQQDPAYYSHFSISKIEDGRLKLQEFGGTWSRTFSQGASVDEGTYLMVSGTRLAGGGVLAHLEFFPVHQDAKQTVPLILRKSQEELQVIGNFDSESLYTTLEGEHKSLLSTTGRGYYVVGLIQSNHEPTNHALKDIAAVAEQLQAWGRSIILLFPSQDEADRFKAGDFVGLPSNVSFGVADAATAQAIGKNEVLKGEGLPVFFMADTFNRIVWFNQGYTIGLGEQLLQVIKKL